MRTRIQLRNATRFVEWDDTPTGEIQARAFRRSHKEFARRKLRRVIQAYPERIECGTIYDITYP